LHETQERSNKENEHMAENTLKFTAQSLANLIRFAGPWGGFEFMLMLRSVEVSF